MSNNIRQPDDSPFHVVTDSKGHRLMGPLFGGSLPCVHGDDARDWYRNIADMLNTDYAMGRADERHRSSLPTNGGTRS